MLGKHRNPLRLVLGAGVVVAVAALIVMLPERLPSGTAGEGREAESITLRGLARDFRRDHPDFGATPPEGSGHCAAVVGMRLNDRRRPVLGEDGYLVDRQWRDANSRAIPPHLAGLRGLIVGTDSLGLRVSGRIELKDECLIDAFTSARGPYGINGNHGGHAYVSTNAVAKDAVKIDKKAILRGDLDVGPGGDPNRVVKNEGVVTGFVGRLDTPYAMPDPVVPEDLGPYEDHVHVEGPVTLTGDTDPDDEIEEPAMHVGKLHVKDHAVVTIVGDLVIVCDRDLKIDKVQIVLEPDATLTIIVRGGPVNLKHDTLVDAPSHGTTAFTLVALGRGSLKIEKDTHVYGTIIAPERTLEVKEGQLYGAFIGAGLKLDKKGSAVHVDVANAEPGSMNPAITVREKIEVEDHSDVDSFDSNLGPYGGSNVGESALLMTQTTKKDKVKVKKNTTVHGDVMVGSTPVPHRVVKIEDHGRVTGQIGSLPAPPSIPFVAPPAMGSSVGDVEYKGGAHVISADLHCKKLKLEDRATLRIENHVTIRCDDKLEIKKQSSLDIMPGASLTLYVKKGVKVEDGSSLNMNTGNPQLVSVRQSSVGKKAKFELKKHSQAAAWILGGKTELKVEEHSEFFGSIAGDKIKVKKSKLHVDMAYLTPCLDVADARGLPGADANGGITSETTFGQWFSDRPGINVSLVRDVTLTRGGDGAWEFLSDAFHLLDGAGFGREDETHNNHFTYAIAATFEYAACSGGFVELEGGDGTWIFIDGQLALDLGGHGALEGQRLDIDRLGLDDGTHALHLFYAQRQPTASVFRLRTNLDLETRRSLPVSRQFD